MNTSMKKLAVVLAVVLILGSTVAACWLVNVWHESDVQKAKITEIRKMAVRGTVTDLKGGLEPVTEPSAAPQSGAESLGEPILHDFAVLKEKNPDCIGWVFIPGTSIDFPVMQNSDFYLKSTRLCQRPSESRTTSGRSAIPTAIATASMW